MSGSRKSSRSSGLKSVAWHERLRWLRRAGRSMTGLADSPLGRAAKYPERHDPALLFSIERAPQRALLGFDGAPPFGGVDLWTAYELSWLDAAGKPQVAIATFAVPADSPRLVESKSVKLYLAGLNLTRFGAESDVAATLARDLGRAVGAAIEVTLTPPHGNGSLPYADLSGICIDALPIAVERYEPSPEALVTGGPMRERDAVLAAVPVRLSGHGTTRLRLRADRLSRDADRSRRTPALPRVVSPASRFPRALRRAHLRGRLGALPAGSADRLRPVHAARRHRHQPVSQLGGRRPAGPRAHRAAMSASAKGAR